MRSAVAAALLLATPLLGYHSADDPSFRQLLDEHRWFELRDAIGGRSVPPLYAGAVAVAFHQTRDAERLLRRAVRDARTSTEANEARELLAGVYMRASHSAELVRTLDEMLAEHVPLLVFSDAHPMWGGRPPGRQGLVALPIAIALGGISWRHVPGRRCDSVGEVAVRREPRVRLGLAAGYACDGRRPDAARLASGLPATRTRCRRSLSTDRPAETGRRGQPRSSRRVESPGRVI